MMSYEGLRKAPHVSYLNKFKDVNWTDDPEKELPIKMRTYGFGSESPMTLGQAFII